MSETRASDAPPARGARGSRTCAISGQTMRARDGNHLSVLRPILAERIRRDHPHLDEDAFISGAELARYRGLIVEEILRDEHVDITGIERQVIDSLARQEVISENIEEEFETKRTIGERMSDGLASFGGSWRFIILFAVLMAVWMIVNIAQGEKSAFDAYPFILLNLVLSCLAAIQAPIIMMSQKRQETKDRLRSLNEYRINLKAELEIRHLHDKIDHLLTRQWERLTAIQQLQLEQMYEISERRTKSAQAGPQRPGAAIEPGGAAA